MKYRMHLFIICTIITMICFIACGKSSEYNNSSIHRVNNNGLELLTNITNEKMKNYPFLRAMYKDSYFPKFLVDKGKNILIKLCISIEKQNPINLEELYKLTHKATEEFNDLAEDFYKYESEIETVARDIIGTDFETIALNYGFKADVEELIAPRDW